MSAITSETNPLPAAPALRLERLQQLALGVLQRVGLIGAGLLLPLALFGLWQHAVTQQWLPEQILPPPALVWTSLLELYRQGELQTHLAISLQRVGWSVLYGGSIGLALGIGMGVSARARAYLYPSFEVLSQFPVVGWVPLLIIFVGIDEALKISAVSLSVIVPVAVNSYKGIGNIPRALFEVAKVYDFSLRQVITGVVLPAALPSIFNGIRQGVMQAWLALVFVELLASSEGLGYLMVWGRQLLQLDLVIVAMIVIGLVGVLLDRSLTLIERRLQGWRNGAF